MPQSGHSNRTCVGGKLDLPFTFRASKSFGDVGMRVWWWLGCGQYAWVFMKLARFRISGEGEWEKEWKRLSGWSSTRSGDGAAARPTCVRKREGPCRGMDRARDVEFLCDREGRAGRIFAVVCRLGLMAVDFHLRRGASWDGDDGLRVRLAFSFFRHLGHVKPDCIVCIICLEPSFGKSQNVWSEGVIEPKYFNQSESRIVFPVPKSFNLEFPTHKNLNHY